jgi:hypothetical protein
MEFPAPVVFVERIVNPACRIARKVVWISRPIPCTAGIVIICVRKGKIVVAGHVLILKPIVSIVGDAARISV